MRGKKTTPACYVIGQFQTGSPVHGERNTPLAEEAVLGSAGIREAMILRVAGKKKKKLSCGSSGIKETGRK